MHASMKGSSLGVLYAIQNVGGIDLEKDLGDSVPVKQTLHGLRRAGHEVSLLRLSGRRVDHRKIDSDSVEPKDAPLGITGTTAFRLGESAVRRAQVGLRLPYFALFDSARFYEACLRTIPDYDLCHEHNGLFCVGAALACARRRVPYVLTFSADAIYELDIVGRPLRGLHRLVAIWEARLTYRLAQRIICVSEVAKKRLTDVWKVDPDKIAVLPNGVDVNLFRPGLETSSLRSSLNLGDDPVVAFVGGFQPWHGLGHLLDSFQLVLRELPRSKLLLVGDGPMRGELEATIERQGIGGAVRIVGLVPQSEVPSYLAVADVAVVPYPQLPAEIWFSPLKMYEYMAAGNAIIAARGGQVTEVIRDGHNGLLVKAGDAEDMARSIIALLREPGERRRLGANARQQAVDRHSWDRYINRLEEVYREAIDLVLLRPRKMGARMRRAS